MCVLVIAMYSGTKVEFYNIHLLYLSKHLQFWANKSAISNICLKKL